MHWRVLNVEETAQRLDLRAELCCIGKLGYEEKNTQYNQQVDLLRQKTEQRMNEVIDQARLTAKSRAAPVAQQTGGGEELDLRSRISTAIQVLQEGLVERDTEVRAGAKHDFGRMRSTHTARG
jgi:hypothetical protein